MQYTNLGKSGLRVSRLCLGTWSYDKVKTIDGEQRVNEWRTWKLPEEAAREHIQRALDLGINFFDTADSYGNGMAEEFLGRALKDMVSHREDVVIATKVYFGTTGRKRGRFGVSRKHILYEIDEQLKRLQTDYIDLYQIHRADAYTPFEEVLEALNDCVRAGKVRYIGANSMLAWQFERMLGLSEQNGWSSFVSMQHEYSLINREDERELLPLCRDHGIGVIPWAPYGGGLLAGNRNADGSANTARGELPNFRDSFQGAHWDNNWEIVDVTKAVAAERGVSPAQIALAWVLQQDQITAPIIGATKTGHIDQAVEALDIELSDEECERLESVYKPHPLQFNL